MFSEVQLLFPLKNNWNLSTCACVVFITFLSNHITSYGKSFWKMIQMKRFHSFFLYIFQIVSFFNHRKYSRVLTQSQLLSNYSSRKGLKVIIEKLKRLIFTVSKAHLTLFVITSAEVKYCEGKDCMGWKASLHTDTYIMPYCCTPRYTWRLLIYWILI